MTNRVDNALFLNIMGNYLEALFLGIIQGLTEFLPVSSSAHLVLTPYFFKFNDPGLAFDVALHLGTLLAILLFFYKDWLTILKEASSRLLPFIKNKTQSSLPSQISIEKIIIGTLPAAIAGLLLEKAAEHYFREPILIAITLSLFGFLLWWSDKRSDSNKNNKSQFMYKDVLIIGAAQALAIIPGVSRSGITITTALLLGFHRTHAMRLSFLLSAPLIAGAGILKAKYLISIFLNGGPEATFVLIGIASSAVFGIGAVAILNTLSKKGTFRLFAYYRAILALAIVVITVFINR